MNKYVGPCDYVHLFGWGASKQYGDWGDYDHYEEVGGLDYFRGNIQRVQQQGQAVSVYLDGYLSSAPGQRVGAHAQAWAMKHRDGSPQFVEEYQSYNECPYQEGWRKHLSEAFASHDIQPLVTTDVAGVFGNRFSAKGENVWTLYNANGRSVRAPVLSVTHVPGAVYEDAWNGHKLTPKIEGDRAAMAVELGPKGIGCVTQTLP